MSSLIRYFVTYPCPSCQAELEAEHGRWDGWLLCPSCGKPALPPDVLFGHPMVRRQAGNGPNGLEGDAGPTLEDAPKNAETSDGPAASWNSVGASHLAKRKTTSTAFSLHRVVCLTGLAASLFFALVFYLDRNDDWIGYCGGLAIVFFLLLMRSPRHQRQGQAPTSGNR